MPRDENKTPTLLAGSPDPHRSVAGLQTLRATAEELQALTAGLDEAALAALPEGDRRTYRALRDTLAEITDLVAALPPDLLARAPAVDWRGWAGLRGLLGHAQLGREMPRLRASLDEDLPLLLAALAAELARAADRV